MTTYQGGHAIMLQMPRSDHFERLFKIAQAWIFGQGEWIANEPNSYHLTLQFVGRDLKAESAAAMIQSAFAFAGSLTTIACEFTGRFEVLTTKKGRYLAALVNPASLADTRDFLGACLSELGVVSKDSFGFKPHVTLAEATAFKHLPGKITNLSVWGAVRRPPVRPVPEAVEPFTVECQQLEVKYGSHRMVVEL